MARQVSSRDQGLCTQQSADELDEKLWIPRLKWHNGAIDELEFQS